MSRPEIRPGKRSLLERFLSLFTEVRSGEAASALLLAANVFLILTAYYIIKPVREALILSYEGGAELKSYSAAGQALLLLLVVPLFAWLASTVSRRRLINAVNLFFISNLGLFWLASILLGSSPTLGVVFYLWVGIFNLMVPALFWSFANDVYSTEQGKRLFVIIAFGASAGAIMGGLVAKALADVLDVYLLLLVSAAVLGLALLITNGVEGRHGAAGDHGEAPDPEAPIRSEGSSRLDAFKLVAAKRYLLLIALMMLLLNWVNTTGEYILGRVVEEVARSEAQSGISGADAVAAASRTIVADFYAGFYTTVNVTSVLIQLFLVSRVIKYVGIPRALLVLPVISLLGYSFMTFFPVLAIIRIAKISENATDYSLQNTLRQALFLPTTREEKYKAKQAIDTFFVRSGDFLSAGLVFVGVELLSLSTKGFAMVNLVLAALWLMVSVGIGREYRRQVGEEEKSAEELARLA